jgi:hypothetical protein
MTSVSPITAATNDPKMANETINAAISPGESNSTPSIRITTVPGVTKHQETSPSHAAIRACKGSFSRSTGHPSDEQVPSIRENG